MAAFLPAQWGVGADERLLLLLCLGVLVVLAGLIAALGVWLDCFDGRRRPHAPRAGFPIEPRRR